MKMFKSKVPMFVKRGRWTPLNMQLESFDHKCPFIKYLSNQYASYIVRLCGTITDILIWINNAVFLWVLGNTTVYIHVYMYFHTCRQTNHFFKERLALLTDAQMYFRSDLFLTQYFASTHQWPSFLKKKERILHYYF